ncbi:MAG: DUF3137 domain-containing protein [Lachnospiraceae bacterium]|nr:DUF3137 domain-containing protein [Lachnospiraceae bacterium]
MFKKFFNALKTSRASRYSLIAILVLMVVLCVAGASFGLHISFIIVVMLVLGFPVIIAVGGIGAAAGIVGSAVSNKKSYDEISRSDPALAELEKERGKLQMYNVIYFAVTVLLIIIAAILSQIAGLIIIMILALLVYIFKIYPMNKAFNNTFGGNVVQTEVNRRFTNASYEHGRGLPPEEIGSAAFIGYDSYSGWEYIEGEQGSIHFRSSEVQLQTVSTYTDDDGDSHESYTTVFDGYVYSIPLSRPVSAAVYVASKKQKTHFKDKIETGSEDFDSKLKVYSTDPEAARSLLISQVKAQILRIADITKEPFCLVFNADKLYAFVQNSETSCFSVNLSKDITVAQLRDNVAAHLSEQADLLNILDTISASMM